MHPEQIKAAIRMSGTTPTRIAEEMGLANSTVSQVIAGRAVSARVRKHIAQIVGVSVDKLWPPKSSSLRRSKPAQPKVSLHRSKTAA